jgi:hypothetical protein
LSNVIVDLLSCDARIYHGKPHSFRIVDHPEFLQHIEESARRNLEDGTWSTQKEEKN